MRFCLNICFCLFITLVYFFLFAFQYLLRNRFLFLSSSSLLLFSLSFFSNKAWVKPNPYSSSWSDTDRVTGKADVSPSCPAKTIRLSITGLAKCAAKLSLVYSLSTCDGRQTSETCVGCSLVNRAISTLILPKTVPVNTLETYPVSFCLSF